MGERKGQNHYYPPDFDYKKHGNLNRYHGVHALRERASKIHLGILTIRFEMPFNVWCEGCGNHIGMGVRYNAEKKKVGMYYTTPVYEFRMKCHLCDTYFDIRTDPKNFEYELVSGLKRQDKRPINVDGQIQKDREASQKMATDAMFKLEHGASDKAKLASVAPRMEQLEHIQGRLYDDFTMNQAARKIFRTKKKDLNAQQAVDDALREKSSLGDLPLVAELSEDKKLASMIAKYKVVQSSEERQEEKRFDINNRSIFEKPTTNKRAEAPSNDKNSIVPAKKFRKEDRLNQLRKSLALTISSKKKQKELQDECKSSTGKTESCTSLLVSDMDSARAVSSIESKCSAVATKDECGETPKPEGNSVMPSFSSNEKQFPTNDGESNASLSAEIISYESKYDLVRQNYLSTLGDMYGSSSSDTEDSDSWEYKNKEKDCS